MTKNKIILVCYIEIGNLEEGDIATYVNKIKQTLNTSELKDMLRFYIPTRGEKSSRVECINPVYTDGKEYKKIQKTLKESQNKIDKTLKMLEKMSINLKSMTPSVIKR